MFPLIGMLLSASVDGTARLYYKGRTDHPALVFSHTRHNINGGGVGDTVGSASTSVFESLPSSSGGNAVDIGGKDGSSNNISYNAEVNQASFFYKDQFVLLSAANSLYLYKYQIDSVKDKINDLNRLQNNSRYKVVQTFHQPSHCIPSFACVNSVLSHVVVSAGSNRSVTVLDIGVGREIRNVEDAHPRAIHTVKFPEPSQVCSGSLFLLFLMILIRFFRPTPPF
jgi:hypothetical protein